MQLLYLSSGCDKTSSLTMSLFLANLLRQLANWLVPPIPEPPPVEDPALWRVRELVSAQESAGGPSGEYKRHQVYARLLKEFPERRKRDLAYLIELVIREWS